MLKWLLTFVLACALFLAAIPLLKRLGIGSMPGDFRLRIRKAEVLVPIGSVLFFGFWFWLIGRLV